MRESFEAQATAFAQAPRLTAYSITATFGDGQPGRVNERVVDKRGKFHFDTMTWKAGDIAYQFFKERFPEGITDSQFLSCCQEWVLLVCDDFYPIFLSRVEDCSITLYPQDLDGLVEAWKRYDWCERAMLMIEFGDVVNRGIDSYDEIDSFFSPLIALVLLQRLDDAVIAEFLDGSGLSEVIFEIAALRDRLQPPTRVVRAIDLAIKFAGKVRAKLAVQGKLAKDPKQKDKVMVRDCWDAWQRRPDSYNGKAEFARDMREKFPKLKSQAVIERWCRIWEREIITQPAE